MGGSSKGASYSERALTQEEKDLISQQEISMKQMTDIAAEQFGLGKSDRDYIAKIYRGDLDRNDERVVKRVSEMLSAEKLSAPTKPDMEAEEFYKYVPEYDGKGFETGRTVKEFDQSKYDTAMNEYEKEKASFDVRKEEYTKRAMSDLSEGGIDKMLFDAVKASGSQASSLMDKWESNAQKLGSDYINSLGGISDKFKSKLETSSGAMGTADADIYARTKGQATAGISQAYAESLKQAQGALSRRGLAGSGVEAGVIGAMAGQEAMAKAGAMSQSYQQAIALSDQRRQQQMGIAGQVYGLEQSTAQTGYGIQSGLQGQSFQNRLNLGQQNIANLQTASGVSQGVFGLSQNYLAGASGTAGQTASIAGQSQANIGNLQMQYYNSQQEVAGAQAGAMTSGLFGLGTASILASDARLKTNIQLVDNINGHNIYTWDWIEGHDYGYNKGVLAQEVLEKNPEAVLMNDDGYYMVDYSKLGVL